MPKKFQGENSKAVAAKARKTAAKEAETAKKQKEAEDAYWQDDDKHIKKKQQRKEQEERKKQAVQDKKAEAKALLEKEMQVIEKTTVNKQPQIKVTRAQIQAEQEKRTKAIEKINNKPLVEKKVVVDEKPLEENINRIMPTEVATTIDEAIAMLSESNIGSDKHPEKRLKAAYTAYEEKYLPILKQENPTLRLSQLKQMLFKDWQKSSENPLNQAKN